jgi:hypothetical protein
MIAPLLADILIPPVIGVRAAFVKLSSAESHAGVPPLGCRLHNRDFRLAAANN